MANIKIKNEKGAEITVSQDAYDNIYSQPGGANTWTPVTANSPTAAPTPITPTTPSSPEVGKTYSVKDMGVHGSQMTEVPTPGVAPVAPTAPTVAPTTPATGTTQVPTSGIITVTNPNGISFTVDANKWESVYKPAGWSYAGAAAPVEDKPFEIEEKPKEGIGDSSTVLDEESAAESFVYGDDFLDKEANDAAVNTLYNAYFGRDASQAEIDNWGRAGGPDTTVRALESFLKGERQRYDYNAPIKGINDILRDKGESPNADIATIDGAADGDAATGDVISNLPPEDQKTNNLLELIQGLPGKYREAFQSVADEYGLKNIGEDLGDVRQRILDTEKFYDDREQEIQDKTLTTGVTSRMMSTLSSEMNKDMYYLRSEEALLLGEFELVEDLATKFAERVYDAELLEIEWLKDINDRMYEEQALVKAEEKELRLAGFTYLSNPQELAAAQKQYGINPSNESQFLYRDSSTGKVWLRPATSIKGTQDALKPKGTGSTSLFGDFKFSSTDIERLVGNGFSLLDIRSVQQNINDGYSIGDIINASGEAGYDMPQGQRDALNYVLKGISAKDVLTSEQSAEEEERLETRAENLLKPEGLRSLYGTTNDSKVNFINAINSSEATVKEYQGLGGMSDSNQKDLDDDFDAAIKSQDARIQVYLDSGFTYAETYELMQ